MTGTAIKDYIKNVINEIKEFIKQASFDIDYKEKNLDEVGQVITIMAAIGDIQMKNKYNVIVLDVIDEMIKPLKKVYGETKELVDWSKDDKYQNLRIFQKTKKTLPTKKSLSPASTLILTRTINFKPEPKLLKHNINIIKPKFLWIIVTHFRKIKHIRNGKIIQINSTKPRRKNHIND